MRLVPARKIRRRSGGEKSPPFRYFILGASMRKVKFENSLAGRFPELEVEWHPSNPCLASEISYGSGFAATWICADGHIWSLSVNSRRGGGTGKITNCPECRKLVSESLTRQRSSETAKCKFCHTIIPAWKYDPDHHCWKRRVCCNRKCGSRNATPSKAIEKENEMIKCSRPECDNMIHRWVRQTNLGWLERFFCSRSCINKMRWQDETYRNTMKTALEKLLESGDLGSAKGTMARYYPNSNTLVETGVMIFGSDLDMDDVL